MKPEIIRTGFQESCLVFVPLEPSMISAPPNTIALLESYMTETALGQSKCLPFMPIPGSPQANRLGFHLASA
jgi:hypothetical protein